METVFDKSIYENLISRIMRINENAIPLWGRMNVDQMLHHLNMTMEAPLGKLKPKGKPVFLMRIFRGILYNDKPFSQGSPTPKDFKVTENFDFNHEKQEVLNNLKEIFEKGIFATYKPHVFFGTLTSEQWGKHFYKHTDHHLRQFGV